MLLLLLLSFGDIAFVQAKGFKDSGVDLINCHIVESRDEKYLFRKTIASYFHKINFLILQYIDVCGSCSQTQIPSLSLR